MSALTNVPSPLAVRSLDEAVPAVPLDLPAGSTAVVYCEGQFGEQDGKTANGLVRHSERYEILSVIDRRQAADDDDSFLDGRANGIRVDPDHPAAVAAAGQTPDFLICGVAPADRLL